MTGLSTKIKSLREAKGLSPSQLATGVPVAKGYLSAIEHGKNPDMHRRLLIGFAKALDVRVDYLIDESTETRSWEKVAADESLELFLKVAGISEEDKSGLRRVTFKEDAPLTLKAWEQFWNCMKAFQGPKRFEHPPKQKQRTFKNSNPSNSMAESPNI